MTKWEHTYVLIAPSDDPCTEINKLGDEGWEAFAVTPENDENHGVIYLKRPVVAPAPRRRVKARGLRFWIWLTNPFGQGTGQF